MYVTVSFESLCSAVEKPMFLRPTVHSAVFFLDRQDLHTFAARQNSEKPQPRNVGPADIPSSLAGCTHTYTFHQCPDIFSKDAHETFFECSDPSAKLSSAQRRAQVFSSTNGECIYRFKHKACVPPVLQFAKNNWCRLLADSLRSFAAKYC